MVPGSGGVGDTPDAPDAAGPLALRSRPRGRSRSIRLRQASGGWVVSTGTVPEAVAALPASRGSPRGRRLGGSSLPFCGPLGGRTRPVRIPPKGKHGGGRARRFPCLLRRTSRSSSWPQDVIPNPGEGSLRLLGVSREALASGVGIRPTACLSLSVLPDSVSRTGERLGAPAAPFKRPHITQADRLTSEAAGRNAEACRNVEMLTAA
jgi:hypothetical protein